MKRVVVVGLVALALVAVVVVVGVTHPGGRGDPSRPDRALGPLAALVPAANVTVADVQGRSCWSGATLVVPTGGRCVTPLPDRATRLTICVVTGSVQVQVAGTSYGPQRVQPSRLGCPPPQPIQLYDQGSRLVVACLAGSCRLRLV